MSGRTRKHIRIIVDGAHTKRCSGWGVVIVSSTEEWVSFGTCSATNSDEVEFIAALQGLQLADRLDLFSKSLRKQLITDSSRLVFACRNRIRMYCKADWDRLADAQHVLSNVCLHARKEILGFQAQHGLDIKWLSRNSTLEQIRADALASLGRAKFTDETLKKTGLTRQQALALDSRESKGICEQINLTGQRYEPCPDFPQVFVRRLHT